MSNFPTSLPTTALRTAMEARDVNAIVDAFAPDAEFRSPFTGKLVFKGHDQIRVLTKVILKVFEGFAYAEELSMGGAGVLVSNARVDGQSIEMIDFMRFRGDGKIQTMTIFVRPLPAAAAALQAIGAGLGRQKSAARAAVIGTLSAPLAFMTRVGDAIGVRLIRSALAPIRN
jgi:hypothetical protein